jgi:hypothetical protein
LKVGVWKGTQNRSYSYKAKYKKGILIKGESTLEDGTVISYDREYEGPTYEGKPRKSFVEHVQRSFRYSPEAKSQNFKDEIFLSLTIARDGTIKQPFISRDSGMGINDEVLRIINQSGKWTPARHHGVPVQTTLVLPIPLDANSNPF